METMLFVKWLKPKNDTDAAPKQVKFKVVSTFEEDARGFEIEGFKGKWLQSMNTFVGDANKNILSINPLTNPALADYEEVEESEALAQIKVKEDAAKVITDQKLAEREVAQVAAVEKEELRKDLLVDAFDTGKIYGGDKKLFEAVLGFDVDKRKADKAAKL